MTVIVHSSLSAIADWVVGGASAVILALESVLTPQGNLVMPTQSGDLSDPADWQSPPVPEAWWARIRQEMPAFRPDLTETREMGRIPETFRKQEGVLRSSHPQTSFAAWGQHAAWITANHGLAEGLGEQSPLARIYDLAGYVLLLGVAHNRNTSLHLAEYRANFPGKRTVPTAAPILVDGIRQWTSFQTLDITDEDFVTIGAAFAETTNHVRQGKVGQATALFMAQRPLIDFAVSWMEAHRKG
ncbi:MAG: AAC(3) family N-acetyltransferase [Caldilineaceae bacterium]|nr:AAC(3) family N-acetyltransferase [Caldilineaceae bacterium]